MRHDWPVKKAIVDLPIGIKGNSKRTSVNLLSPLGAQNKDLDAASQTLLTEVNIYVCDADQCMRKCALFMKSVYCQWVFFLLPNKKRLLQV